MLDIFAVLPRRRLLAMLMLFRHAADLRDDADGDY